MINQFEMPMYIEDAVPEIKVYDNHTRVNPYNAMSALLQFTSNNIKAHNYNAVKRSFNVADKLYCKGDNVVKNAVQNVFIFSFSSIFQNNPDEKKQLMSLLPGTLYAAYLSQVCHGGC